MTPDALLVGAEAGAPLHRRLREALLAPIRAGAWAPGARIASERELCESHGVSRTTARRAIADLVHEGVLVTVGGKGTFVAGRRLRQELQPLVGFSADLAAQGFDVRAELLELRRVEAPEAMALALEVRLWSPVVRLRRLRLAGTMPLALQTSFLPEHLCPGLLRLDWEERSLYATLREEYGLTLAAGSTTIQAGLAGTEEAGHLGIAPGGPVLRTFQTTRDAAGRVVERCDACFAGDRFQLTVGGTGAVKTVYAEAGPEDAPDSRGDA